ncbi:hypothetical protein F8388_020227 [Cannabis sativa]|uniref:TF-B3 domain-containing protein n=1 Tax=Cannabis sativa TaxID=3483 RepID=A0A7J6FVC6_CANSA|nr:hypothetical protein F8388_020227 [Cannabis sativa]
MDFGSSARDNNNNNNRMVFSHEDRGGVGVAGASWPATAAAAEGSIDDHNHLTMMMNGPDTKLELMNSSPASTTTTGNGNGHDDVVSMSSSRSEVVVEREHMFDKVVTPSDVGKLNRLVIPKQHAEKYFPLDSSTNEKGLLLNFEDRNGKPWRFRYSYWNSSQSYVMTKGWSRFVKEKKLDAGDIVSFQRGLADKERLFIDWRRRPEAVVLPDHHHHHSSSTINIPFSSFRSSNNSNNFSWSPSLMRPPPPMNYGGNIFNLHPYRTTNSYGGGGGCYNGYGNVSNSAVYSGSGGSLVFYLRPPHNNMVSATTLSSNVVAEDQYSIGMVQNHHPSVVYGSVPVAHGNNKAGVAATAAAAGGKRLRLFGVNMECSSGGSTNSPSDHDQSEECELISSHNYHNISNNNNNLHHHSLHHSSSSSSSPSQNANSLSHGHQLRLYNGTPIPGISTVDFLNKGKAFNFDI